MDPKIKPIALTRSPLTSLAPLARSPRSLATALTLAVLGTAFLAVFLTACGGGGGATTPPPSGPTVGALQASQPGELLAYVKGKLRERQDTRLAQASNAVMFPMMFSSDAVTSGAAPSGAVAAATSVERSGTTVQEGGVDEDDVLKSDGTLLVALARESSILPAKPAARVMVHRRRADGSPELAGSAVLNSDAEASTFYSGLYLASAAQRVVALGASQTFYALDFCAGLTDCASITLLPFPRVSKPKVALDVVSTSNPAAPTVGERWRIDGHLMGSRLIGNSLTLVTQFTPQLAVDVMPYNAPAAEREAQLARLTSAELLPTISINGAAPVPLVGETDCYVEPKNASYGIQVTTITTVDVTTLARRSRCFVGGSEALYMSQQALYLATTSYSVPLADASGRIAFPGGITTDIHKFALGGTTVDYRGTGTVDGHLGWDEQSRSYRFSEHNGDLRVVTFTGQTGWRITADAQSLNAPPPSPGTLSILRERASDKSLQRVATLPNAQRPAPLGKPGEQVYAVRFVGDRGYVVTFRRIDPLYVLDLSNPADPKTVGELDTAGFSSYLFPMGAANGGLLLGVGHDADDRGAITGVKVALFDVADAARPAVKGSFTLGDLNTQSALDASRHGIDLFARGSTTRVVLPTLGWNGTSNQRPFALNRFEVDATARTLVSKSALAAANVPAGAFMDLGDQRTMQIGDQVYFWNGQALAMFGW